MNLDDSCSVEWCNVFGFGIAGIANAVHGSRVPAVFLHKNNYLHICSHTTRNYHCWDSDAMPTGKWFNLKIKQEFVASELLYKVYINDEEVHFVQNTHYVPENFENVNGVIGNLYDYDDFFPAPAQYRNFLFTSEGKRL